MKLMVKARMESLFRKSFKFVKQNLFEISILILFTLTFIFGGIAMSSGNLHDVAAFILGGMWYLLWLIILIVAVYFVIMLLGCISYAAIAAFEAISTIILKR